MAPQSQLPQFIRFDVFAVDVRAGELRRNGAKLKLQEQPFQVLCALLEHPGELVTREELRSRLWPADTFVDFDHGLNAAIRRLREALGDSAEIPRFVETVARFANSVRPCVWRGISIGRPLPTVKPWLSSVCVRGVISILHSPPMVKHWPLPEFRTESSQSTQCRFREERSSVLSRAVHTNGVWRGRRTVGTSFSPRLVGSQRTVRFGRYPSAGVSQHACSSVKGESNL